MNDVATAPLRFAAVELVFIGLGILVFREQMSYQPARWAQQEGIHPLYCVDKGFTFALAFALCANCAHFVAA